MLWTTFQLHVPAWSWYYMIGNYLVNWRKKNIVKILLSLIFCSDFLPEISVVVCLRQVQVTCMKAAKIFCTKPDRRNLNTLEQALIRFHRLRSMPIPRLCLEDIQWAVSACTNKDKHVFIREYNLCYPILNVSLPVLRNIPTLSSRVRNPNLLSCLKQLPILFQADLAVLLFSS